MLRGSRNEKKGFTFSLFNNVKTKLIVMMLVVSIIPLVTLGLFSTNYSQNMVKEELGDSSLQLVKELSSEIDTLIQGIGGQVNLLANNINFTEYYENENNATYGFFLLDGTRQTRDDYKHVYFAPSKGDILLSPKEVEDSLPPDFDPTTRDWYKDAVENKGELVIGSPYNDEATGDVVVTLSKTVEKNGQIMGVIGIDVNLQDFADSVNEVVVGHKGYAVLVNEEGLLITHPNPELIGTDTVKSLSVWEDMQKAAEGKSEYTFNGASKYSVYTTNEQTDWKVLATLEEEEFTGRTKGIEIAIWVMMAGFAVVAGLIAFFFSGRMVKNIRIVQHSIERASEGDLTTRVTVQSNDEFKQLESSYNKMMDNLSVALLSVEESSKTVLKTASSLSEMTEETTASVSQVATAISEVAQGTQSQAENVQNAAVEMDKLSTNLDDISTTTEEMNQATNKSVELGNKGLQQVKLLTEKSTQTKASSEEVSNVIQEVVESIKEISAFVETISAITEQTNLLSLNASIEAARAGEHGKGFAVVANEVRKLADESKQSANNVTNIIANIENVVTQAVKSVDATSKHVNDQEIVVGETRDIFANILEALEQVTKKSEEVRKSVEIGQQNKEIVMEETSNISAVSEQTASSSQEVSASSEEISATMEEFSRHASDLATLSHTLEENIRKFKLK